MVLARITTREELKEYRASKEDDDYTEPPAGGCWICYRGTKGEVEDMRLDIEFDTYYHPECLWEVGAESITDFESGNWMDD